LPLPLPRAPFPFHLYLTPSRVPCEQGCARLHARINKEDTRRSLSNRRKDLEVRAGRKTLLEPPKFTQAEMAGLIAEAAAWIRQQRDKYHPLSDPLSENVKIKLRPFFPGEILDRVRIRHVSPTGESIPYPPFYERVRAGGSRVVPDAAHMTAIPFLDVALFNREPTLRTTFHNLVHVTQFSVVGLERVMEGYFRTLNESGLWMVVPYEEQAYKLDARYTKDPSDVFSVEEEVREWLQSGKF